MAVNRGPRDHRGLLFGELCQRGDRCCDALGIPDIPLRGEVAWRSTVDTNVASDALANLTPDGVTGGTMITIGEDCGEGSSALLQSGLAPSGAISNPCSIAPVQGHRPDSVLSRANNPTSSVGVQIRVNGRRSFQRTRLINKQNQGTFVFTSHPTAWLGLRNNPCRFFGHKPERTRLVSKRRRFKFTRSKLLLFLTIQICHPHILDQSDVKIGRR